MPDYRNFVSITGNLAADPELVANDKILKLRLASNFSGREGNETVSGFFDVVYFMTGEDRNIKFVQGQLENFKKGTQLGIVGRLVQDRWDQDGAKRSAVRIYADNIAYAGSPPKKDEEGEGSSGELPMQF